MSIHFEDQPSDKQRMTFKTYREFANKNMEGPSLPKEAYAREKVYSNFAQFLSDQCPWHLVLRANGKEKHYIGPLFVQMNECLMDVKESTPFVKMFNRAARYRRFPGVAVQEALENALIHFDPKAGWEITIDITEDLMTITSPGGSYELGTGPRNPRLASFLENYGTVRLSGKGIVSIRNCYSSSGMMPVLIGGTDSFKTLLPSLDNTVQTVAQGSDSVLEYLRQNNKGGMLDMCKTMAFTVHRMALILDRLEEENRIFTTGLGPKRVAFYIKGSDAEQISETEESSMQIYEPLR